jgi:tetratricopeptide (TPR) repeat protein
VTGEGEAVAMLLRSASSPLLNAARVPAAAAEHLAVVPMASPAGHRQGALCRALSEADLLAPLPLPAARTSSAPAAFVEEDEDVLQDEDDEDVFRRLLTSAGLALDLDAAALGREEAALALLEGVGGDGGRGRACRGGHGGRGGDGDGNGDEGHGAADAHYRRMIRANPGNALPLGNYARYLREVEGDAARAQEYCERAIVADPGDGDALALYAGLVWETSRDAQRADAYYSRAVQAAPDDW